MPHLRIATTTEPLGVALVVHVHLFYMEDKVGLVVERKAFLVHEQADTHTQTELLLKILAWMCD